MTDAPQKRPETPLLDRVETPADLKRMTAVPSTHRLALIAVAALVVIQLVPAPFALRRALEPGFADVMAGVIGGTSALFG